MALQVLFPLSAPMYEGIEDYEAGGEQALKK